MGIPSFYKWLVNRYPSIVSPAKEEPDGIVYDNLYIDMNCIIHHCFHPQDNMYADTDDVCPPTTVSEVFQSIFEYLDGLLCTVRPRRLLYLAVDGVAPCAKMNRLRRGRFHSARLARQEELEEEETRNELIAQGEEVPPREISEVSDSNAITPGTEFMEKLSQALEYYIRARLNTDPGWKDIVASSCSFQLQLFEGNILSDANVPGEGEHKIMSFIRAQRGMEGYDPNTRHCLFGHDADLIMLALASHEVHFSILREDLQLPNQAENDSELAEAVQKKPYLFLNIWVLREYLEIELKMLDPIFKPDIERLIDDFVFISFLVGNDFIPHIPSLEMDECALDLLIEVYKTTFNKMGGYIVNTDKVKDKLGEYLEISRLEMFFHELSMYEEKIFIKRYELEQKFLHEAYREMLREAPESKRSKMKERLDNLFFNEERPYDRIRLGLPGWKSRFYREYFDVETSNEIRNLQNDMGQKYLEGLCWVLQCYFSDVPSWSWYYPFYVAPFISDLKGLSRFQISFTVDKPLRPFDQLMAVLPSKSWCLLPKCYGELLGRLDFSLFQTDTNGKRFLWNVCEEFRSGSWARPRSKMVMTRRQEASSSSTLRGISEEALLSVTKVVDTELTIDESRRNTTGQEKIFVHRNSNSLPHKELIEQKTPYPSPQKLPIDSATSGIGGWLSPNDSDGSSSGSFHSPITNLQDITDDQAISATFFNPEAVNPVPRRLLDTVKVPEKTVTGADISKRPLWHTYPGSRPPRPPRIVQRPDTIWKPSTTATPREEHKNAGTGWLGRGRANALAAAETQLTNRCNSYGHGAGKGTAAETQRSSSSYSYSFRRMDMAQSRGSSSRWTGGGGDGGAGHGVSAQSSSLGW